MSKKMQLQVPKPCHENWDQMTPSEKGRFCGSCQKHVIDFSTMADREIAQHFKRPTPGEICGRFTQDQLNRTLEIPRKRIPWLKYFFQFALPAFLASSKIYAQGSVVKVVPETCVRPSLPLSALLQPIVKDTSVNNNTIKGKVIDEKGNPVCGAVVVIKGTNIGTTTDARGYFEIRRHKVTKLMISALGYDQLEVESKEEVECILHEATVLENLILGQIVPFFPEKKEPAVNKTIPLIPQQLKDSMNKYFKVFPNPLQSGGSLVIEWKEAEEGYYVFELFSMNGQAVYRREIWIDAEARLLNLDIPQFTAGTYTIRISNKKSLKQFTDKLVIR